MISVPLVADTNVISYMFERSPLGVAYRDLIDGRRVGFTGLRCDPWLEEQHRRANRLG
jgi:hypothetical protein